MSFGSHSSDVIVSGLKLNESLRAVRPRKVTKAFVLCAARAGLDHSNYLLFYFGATLAVLLVLVVLIGDLYLVCLLFYSNNYKSFNRRSVSTTFCIIVERTNFPNYIKTINYSYDNFLIS